VLDVLYKVAKVHYPPTSTTQISRVVLTSSQKEPLFEFQIKIAGTRRSVWVPGAVQFVKNYIRFLDLSFCSIFKLLYAAYTFKTDSPFLSFKIT